MRASGRERSAFLCRRRRASAPFDEARRGRDAAGMRTFASLPPPDPSELRCEGASREQLLAALAPLHALRRRRLAGAAIGAALAAFAGLLGVSLQRSLGRALLELAHGAGLRGDTASALEVTILFGPAAAFALFALVSWLRLPAATSAALLPELLARLGDRVRGPFSLSLFWGLTRPGPASPFDDTALVLFGTLASGAPFALGVDVLVSRRSRAHFQPSGVGVSRRPRSTTSSSYWLFLETPPRASAPAPPAPLRSLQDDARLLVEHELGDRAPTAAQLAALVEAVG